MPRKPLSTIAFISWMVLVTLLSLFSFSEDSFTQLNIPFLDKIAHFVFYFGAVILGCLALREMVTKKLQLRKAIGYNLGFAMVYGIIIEVLQEKYTTFRDGNVYDVMANLSLIHI